MKRPLIASLLLVLVIGLLFATASADTLTKVDITPYPAFTVSEYAYVMDSGAPKTTALPYEITGEIICIDTIPGADTKAPTDDYDLKAKNAQGIDIMGGALGNRDSANAERAWPKNGETVIYTGVPTQGSLSLYRENNLVKNAEVTVRIFVKNQHRNWR